MKISLSWLNDFLPLNLSVEEIAEALTLAGLEVEKIETSSEQQDAVLDIGLTPNLGHCMSVLGIARELSAILNIPLNPVSIEVKEQESSSIQGALSLTVDNPELCPLYAVRLVHNITVGPSPDWMQKRLTAAGIRAINTIVDVGNYVMLELGSPLHMFDYDTLKKNEICLSSGCAYPVIKTLDGEIRDIPSHSLMICDSEKPIAFAGIMGSEDSSVTADTTNIVIEASQFKAESIRKTAKEIHLRTEGSQRHEKGIDSEGVLRALDRAAALLQECAGGKVAKGVLLKRAKPFVPTILSLRVSRVNAILGTTLSQNEIVSLLERLEIVCRPGTADLLSCEIPSYRNDLTIEIDLIEEIARIYGFNNIPQGPPRYLSSPIPHVPLYLFEKETRAHLISLGLQECLTCDLISPELAKLTMEHGQSFISVLHPTSIEQSLLRLSLLPGLLQVIKHNQDHQNSDVHAFELGHIHFKQDSNFIEQTTVGIILTGKTNPHYWEEKPLDITFYDLKGKVEGLLSLMGIQGAQFEPSHLHNFHPFRQARIKIKDNLLGALGEIHPGHLAALGITKRVYFAELNLHALFPLKRQEWQFKEISRYPGSERDWTLSLKMETPIADVVQAIEAHLPIHLEKMLLLDLYKSPQIGNDRKNATFRFFYRDLQKTIAQDTVEHEHTKLTQTVAEKLGNHLC